MRQSNLRGTLSYARGGPNTRGTQLYINLADNIRLDTTSTFGFPPIGAVVSGMTTVDSINPEYTSRRGSQGTCPSQDSIQTKGNAYLERHFPRLDYIKAARVTKEWRGKRSGN